jgi:hypothetical protein
MAPPDPGGLTGWKLLTVNDDTGVPAVAKRVVVTVSPDQNVWAHYIDVNDKIVFLQLPLNADRGALPIARPTPGCSKSNWEQPT